MKLLYKPFGIIAGIIAGLLSEKLFEFIWSRIDDEKAPKPTTRGITMRRAVVSAALQGAVFRGTRAAVDRQGARGFHYLTGVWPGPQEPEKTHPDR